MNGVSFFCWALLVILSDQVSKFYILKNISINQSLEIIPEFFNLTLVQNTGTAFGLCKGNAFALSLLTIVTVILLIFYFLKYAKKDRLLSQGLCLIVGGAVGNFMDRVFRGHVVDFLDFYLRDYHWYAFNIADSAISIGAGLLILKLMQNPKVLES